MDYGQQQQQQQPDEVYRARSGSNLSGSNPEQNDAEGNKEVEEILRNTQALQNGVKTEYVTYFRQNQTSNSANQHETPITSPSMSNDFKTDTDTDGNGFHGGMESDDVDSTADCHRKRNESRSRSGPELHKKRARKRAQRTQNNLSRQYGGHNGNLSSSQLSSPNGECTPDSMYPSHHPHHNTKQYIRHNYEYNYADSSSRMDTHRERAVSHGGNRQTSKVRNSSKPQLRITIQPNDHHRARYESEGSRGAVKDQSGESSPKIKLENYTGNATIPVHVFVANDKGAIKPHVFFRTCKIASRNSTHCEDSAFDLLGHRTEAIMVQLTPKDQYTATIDCVGILKLRNADVENESKSKSQPKPKRRNPTVRLAFYAQIPLGVETGAPTTGGDDEQHHALEYVDMIVASNPISCSQPEGQPEILRISLHEGSPEGGDEVFIIGKNFNKNCQVVFVLDEWCAAADINNTFTTKEHLVVTTPKFLDMDPERDSAVKVHIKSHGKLHEPHDKEFVYKATQQNNEPNPLIDNKFSTMRIENSTVPFSLSTPTQQQQQQHQAIVLQAQQQQKHVGRNSLGEVRQQSSRPTPYDRIDKTQTMIIDTTKQEIEETRASDLVKPTPIVANDNDAAFDQSEIYSPRPTETVFAASLTSDFKNPTSTTTVVVEQQQVVVPEPQQQQVCNQRSRHDSEASGEPSTKRVTYEPSRPQQQQPVEHIDFDEVKPLPGSVFLPPPTGFTVPSQVEQDQKMIFDGIISNQQVDQHHQQHQQQQQQQQQEEKVKQETHQITDCLTRQIHDYNTQVDFVDPSQPPEQQQQQQSNQTQQATQVTSCQSQSNIPNTSSYATYTNLVQSHSGQPMMSTGHVEPVKTEQEIQFSTSQCSPPSQQQQQVVQQPVQSPVAPVQQQIWNDDVVSTVPVVTSSSFGSPFGQTPIVSNPLESMHYVPQQQPQVVVPQSVQQAVQVPQVVQPVPPQQQQQQQATVVSQVEQEPAVVAVFASRELDPIQSLDELRQIEKIQEQKSQQQLQYDANTYVDARPAWEPQQQQAPAESIPQWGAPCPPQVQTAYVTTVPDTDVLMKNTVPDVVVASGGGDVNASGGDITTTTRAVTKEELVKLIHESDDFRVTIGGHDQAAPFGTSNNANNGPSF